MKQFNLKEYLKKPSRKVVTRDGRNARIICTDRRDLNFPIIALIENISGGGEKACSYTKDGRHYTDCPDIFDLFFAPEKHEGWVNVYKNFTTSASFYCDYVFDSEEEAKMKGGGAIATVKIEWEEYNDKKCNYR